MQNTILRKTYFNSPQISQFTSKSKGAQLSKSGFYNYTKNVIKNKALKSPASFTGKLKQVDDSNKFGLSGDAVKKGGNKCKGGQDIKISEIQANFIMMISYFH